MDQAITRTTLQLLAKWFERAEDFWCDVLAGPGMGFYGTGYDSWGVQTNQKYLSAAAVLQCAKDAPVSGSTRAHLSGRAMAALRYSLHTHVTGSGRRADNSRWGHTWISALGIERMMHGVHLLKPLFTDDDRQALRRVLCSEADWLLNECTRGNVSGVAGSMWNHEGRNAPESNLWNGALLWRVAAMYPGADNAVAWQARAHEFLMNSVNVPADRDDMRVVAGRPVSRWHAGPNFFPHYALDHHGYLNVGYMVICVSNAAMLHFGLRAANLPVPESLYHHQRDLWQVLRRFIFADGRLARIGGDTRVRYAYCQEYLLPALLFAADALGEEHAEELICGQLAFISKEAEYNDDGSFYGKRLARLAADSPYYYTRLESDRACCLGMLAYFAKLMEQQEGKDADDGSGAGAFEKSAGGAWCEHEHGAVLHRSPTRLAAFSWRACDRTQGMCQPPDDGHLAEWSGNLAGMVHFLGTSGNTGMVGGAHRRVVEHNIWQFDGGFVTCGSVEEGRNAALSEGWKREGAQALHWIAFAALPDAHTVIGLQCCRTLDLRSYVAQVKGLHLNLPNDLFNDFERILITGSGETRLRSPADQDGLILLQSMWANIGERVGIVGIYGAESLAVHRAMLPRGGTYRSLRVEEICFGCDLGTRAVDPDTLILDVGWAVLAGVTSEQTAGVAAGQLAMPGPDLRGVTVTGIDGREYALIANFGRAPARVRELLDAVGMQEVVGRRGDDNLCAGQAMVARQRKQI